MTCECYRAEKNFLGEIGLCWGTRERDACSCGGDKSKCDFYPEVRSDGKKPLTNADRIRAMTDEELVEIFANNDCGYCHSDFGKINPRRRPASEEDVRRAWDDGVLAGVTNACAIFLTVLVDKFDGGPYISDVWREINKLSEEIAERRVSVADLRAVLREEYGIEV